MFMLVESLSPLASPWSEQLSAEFTALVLDRFAGLFTGAVGVLVQVMTGLGAFAATNLDDLVILLLFFSGVDERLRAGHVVAGQYLGFSLLVGVSLLGCFGRAVVPESWLGLLGLLPISLGISRLMELLEGASGDDGVEAIPPFGPGGRGRTWGAVLGVAAVTVANGSDNVGVYMPLFAHATPPEVVVTLVVFFLMMGLWCLIAWRLTAAPGLAPVLHQYGDQLIPFVLIGLGGLILIDSHTLHHRGLAVIALGCLGVMVFSIARQLASIAMAPPPSSSLSRTP
jgi:cadmium resistance transport/sequestration family protein